MSDGPEPGASVAEVLITLVNSPGDFAEWPPARQDFALRVARRARLMGRLAADLERLGLRDSLPDVANDQLTAASVHADARRRLALWELDRVAWALGGEPGVRLVALKGAAYLFLELPNAAGRIFADVDLMTDEPTLEHMEAQLNRRGWKTRNLTPYDQNYYRNWTHELPPLVHAEREMEIDLHHNVLPRTARLKPDGALLMEASTPSPHAPYRVLCNEDLVLHAMTHLMYGDDLADKFRDLVDIRDLIEHFRSRDGGFLDRLVNRAERLDLRRPAWYSLRYVERLLGQLYPVAVTARIESWGPPRSVRRLMDLAVPAALLPQHPDTPSWRGRIARLLLYVRSHWIRMPPWLLAYHLAYKATIARFARWRKG